VAPDRVRIEADQVRGHGAELYLGGRRGGGTDWWLSYTWSNIEDRVDGRWLKRSVDQPHALTASMTFRPGDKWSITALATYHTGWPTTPIAAWATPGSGWESVIHYQVGEFYSERLPSYQRLDVRASRTVRRRRSTFTFFVDVRNLFDEDNVRGFAISDAIFHDGDIFPGGDPHRHPVTFPAEHWFGIMPSLGFSWEL
jgi:outer membrane receptor protein involved in Fe transport